jgi:hypothetical protein
MRTGLEGQGFGEQRRRRPGDGKGIGNRQPEEENRQSGDRNQGNSNGRSSLLRWQEERGDSPKDKQNENQEENHDRLRGNSSTFTSRENPREDQPEYGNHTPANCCSSNWRAYPECKTNPERVRRTVWKITPVTLPAAFSRECVPKPWCGSKHCGDGKTRNHIAIFPDRIELGDCCCRRGRQSRIGQSGTDLVPRRTAWPFLSFRSCHSP